MRVSIRYDDEMSAPPFVTISAATALILAGTNLPAQAQIWTVDDGGGADFTAIQSAVNAASTGDVVLVRDGDYAEFTLTGKGISILADEGATVRVLATAGSITTHVNNVPAGTRALLRGITFVPPQQLAGSLVLIENNAGTVSLEDVVAEASTPLPFGYTTTQNETVKIVSSAAVTFVNTDVTGSFGATPGSGLEVGAIGVVDVF